MKERYWPLIAVMVCFCAFSGNQGPYSSPDLCFEVKVISEKTGSPVPGADVIFLDDSTAKSPQYGFNSLFDSRQDVEELLARHGRLHRADDKGVVKLPWPRHGEFVVAARKGPLFGLRFSLKPRAIVTVPVAPARVVRIKVVDVAGKPRPGVGVGLYDRRDLGNYICKQAVTRAPDGVATFSCVGWMLRDLVHSSPKKLVAAFHFPHRKTLDRMVNIDGKTEKTVVLTMPPTGKVIINIKDPKGNLISEGAGVILSWSDSARGKDFVDPNYIMPVPGGKLVLPHVGFDLRFKITPCWGTPQGNSKFGDEIFTMGPTRDGKSTVTIDCPLDNRPPIITGRAVDAAGRPLARRTFQYDTIHEFTGWRLVTTDAKGRFRFTFWWPSDAKSSGFNFVLLPERNGLDCRQKRSIDFLSGEHDIGDIVFAQAPLISKGIVVNHKGEPLVGAKVEVDYRKLVATSMTGGNPFGGMGPGSESPPRVGKGKDDGPPTGPAPKPIWLSAGRPVYSDRQGRFQLRGRLPSEADLVRIRVDHPDYDRNRPLTCKPGEIGLRVVLKPVRVDPTFKGLPQETPVNRAPSGSKFNFLGVTPGEERAVGPLFAAVSNGNVAAVKKLLAAGADLKKTDGKGNGPLHHAVAAGHKEIAQELIKGGADAARRNKGGFSPFFIASVIRQDFPLVAVLMRKEDNSKEAVPFMPLNMTGSAHNPSHSGPFLDPASLIQWNSRFGYRLTASPDWVLYTVQQDGFFRRRSIIVLGLPAIWSDLEKQDISNAVSLIAKEDNKVNSLQAAVTAFKEGNPGAKIVGELGKSAEGRVYFDCDNEDNGCTYRTRTVVMFRKKIIYHLAFTATPGTFKQNLPLFEAFGKSIQFLDPKR